MNITTCHIIESPNGRWSYVGRVPVALTKERDARQADVMGGRAYRRTDGSLATRDVLSFETEIECLAYAELENIEIS